MYQGKWGWGNEIWIWNTRFPHPYIGIKEFEEDLDYFDWEEYKPDDEYNEKM